MQAKKAGKTIDEFTAPFAEDSREARVMRLILDEICVLPTLPLKLSQPGDKRLQAMLFDPEMPDPLHQRAGARAGALSVLCGVAAVESVKTGRAVPVAAQLG